MSMAGLAMDGGSAAHAMGTSRSASEAATSSRVFMDPPGFLLVRRRTTTPRERNVTASPLGLHLDRRPRDGVASPRTEPLVSQTAVARRWIVSPAYDLAFFFGGAAASLMALGLYLAGVPILVLWWTWILAFDGPHIAAAFTRTYLDRDEWRRHGRLLAWSLLAFAAGPL